MIDLFSPARAAIGAALATRLLLVYRRFRLRRWPRTLPAGVPPTSILSAPDLRWLAELTIPWALDTRNAE